MAAASRPAAASIVIPARNAVPFIAKQLAAVIAQMAPSDEIVVVDDGSEDDTVRVTRSLLRELLPERSSVIVNERALGPSIARNQGASAARNDLLIFCDADDVVLPGWLDALRRGLDDHEVVTGKLDPARLNIPDVVWARGWELQDRLARFAGHIPLVRGGNLGIRADVFHAVGGFSYRWGVGEDLDLSLRCYQRQVRVGWIEEAVIAYRFRTSRTALYLQGRAHGEAKRRFQRIASAALGLPEPKPV